MTKSVKKLLIKRQDSVDLVVVVRMCFERVVIRISADSLSNLHNFHCENNVKKYRPPTVQTGVYVCHRCGTGTRRGKSGFYVYRQNKGLYWAKRRTVWEHVSTKFYRNYRLPNKILMHKIEWSHWTRRVSGGGAQEMFRFPPPSYDDGLTDNVEKISNYAQLIIYTYVSAVCQRGGQILCGGVRVAF